MQRDTTGLPAATVDAFTHRGVVQLAEYFSAGGPILFGTDVGYMTDYSTLTEFKLMAEAGMGFRDILASLTTAPIARRGLSANTGRIAVGVDADLVVLRTDPAADIGGFRERNLLNSGWPHHLRSGVTRSLVAAAIGAVNTDAVSVEAHSRSTSR